MKVTRYPARDCWRLVVPAHLSENGRRQARYFATKEQGEVFIARLLGRAPQLAGLSQAERAILEIVCSRMGGLEGLVKAAQFYDSHVMAVPKQTSVQELAEEYLRFQEQEGRSRRTLVDDRYRLRAFAEHFRGLRTVELNPQKILGWLESYKPGTNRANMFKLVRKLSGWAKRHGCLATDPTENMQRPPKGRSSKGIMPVLEFEYLLRACAGLEAVPAAPAGLKPKRGYRLLEDFRPALPAFLLGGFAGLRTSEMVRVHKGEDVFVLSGAEASHAGTAKSRRK
jgi:hypothetical protein